jgi:hypothetical protein
MWLAVPPAGLKNTRSPGSSSSAPTAGARIATRPEVLRGRVRPAASRNTKPTSPLQSKPPSGVLPP